MEDSIVLILMATYNGGKFISQQLDSICNQSYQNWKLLIRDDGSSDSTVDIIKKYAKMDNRIQFIQNETSLHGAYSNFFELIKEAKTAFSKFLYYMFCDQDDIWKKNKIEVLVKEMTKMELDNPKCPILLYSDLTIIDECNRIIHEKAQDIYEFWYENIYSMALFGSAYGCSMIVNHKLMETVQCDVGDNKHWLPHDRYLLRYAIFTGKVKFLTVPLTYYRRHSENVSLRKPKLSVMDIIKKTTFNFKKTLKVHAAQYNTNLIIINKILDLNPDNLFCLKIKELILKGGIGSVCFCLKHNIHKKQKIRNAAFYFILFSKLYKKHLLIRNE